MKALRALAEEMAANVWFKNPFQVEPSKNPEPISELSSDAQRLVRWIRRRELMNQLPLSMIKLQRISVGDLRTIAAVFKDFDGELMREFSREQLIAFIGGRQEDPCQLLPIGKLPHGELIDFG